MSKKVIVIDRCPDGRPLTTKVVEEAEAVEPKPVKKKKATKKVVKK